jgi:putative hemolysin
MPVNPFENHKDAKSSVIGIKETLRHLSDGKPLRIFQPEKFPVTRRKTMVDKPWEEGAIKVIRKAQVPVVPIYSLKSWLFYFLSKISGTFRTKITIRSFSQSCHKSRMGKHFCRRTK